MRRSNFAVVNRSVAFKCSSVSGFMVFRIPFLNQNRLCHNSVGLSAARGGNHAGCPGPSCGPKRFQAPCDTQTDVMDGERKHKTTWFPATTRSGYQLDANLGNQRLLGICWCKSILTVVIGAIHSQLKQNYSKWGRPQDLSVQAWIWLTPPAPWRDLPAQRGSNQPGIGWIIL